MFINLDENSVFFDGNLMNDDAQSVELVKSPIHKGGEAYRLNLGVIVLEVCTSRVIVRPKKESVKRVGPELTSHDDIQDQIKSFGDQIHNLSCSVEDEEVQQVLGLIADHLWSINVETPEEKAAREREQGILAMMEAAMGKPIGGESLEAYKGNAAYRICERLYDDKYRKQSED